MPARAAPIDYRTLAEYLAALGYPLRLELLDVLRFPHTLSEIRLSPQRAHAGGMARVAARQTIQGHLDKLLEVDLLRSERLDLGGRPSPRYQFNALKLYEVTEEMRRLSVLHAGRGAAGDPTGTMVREAPADEARGPRLVLVHGVYEGKAFALDAATSRDGRWSSGAARGWPAPARATHRRRRCARRAPDQLGARGALPGRNILADGVHGHVGRSRTTRASFTGSRPAPPAPPRPGCRACAGAWPCRSR